MDRLFTILISTIKEYPYSKILLCRILVVGLLFFPVLHISAYLLPNQKIIEKEQVRVYSKLVVLDSVFNEQDPEPDYEILRQNLIYPEDALREGIEGEVVVKVLVGKDGMAMVGKVLIAMSTNKIFNQVAIDAIAKTPFTPAIRNGQFIDAWVTVPLNFHFKHSENQKKYEFVQLDSLEPRPEDSIVVEKEPVPDYKILWKNTVYPENARRAGIQGNVLVLVLIGKDGMPKPNKVIIKYSTNSMFNQAAIDAIMKTPFAPAIQNGQPIEVWVTVPMNFQLR